jgi:hypothetical protein
MPDISPLATGSPTLSELRASTFGHLGQFADLCDRIAGKAEPAFEEIATEVRTPGGVEWEGAAGDAAVDQADTDVFTVRDRAWSWRDAAVIARRGQDTLEAGQRQALDAVDDAERDGFRIGEDYSCADTRKVSTRAQLEQRQAKAEAHANYIRHRVTQLVGNDQHLTANLTQATAGWGNLTFPESGGGGNVDQVDHHWKQDGGIDPDSDRKHNQMEAFKKVYGHDPVSVNDWLIAAALDPHSYLPKDHGVPPEIVAGRFTPQPGKGVVRSNMFIPTDQVRNAFKDGTDIKDGRILPKNFGDNREPSATADPEASRVSVFVDYDHGLVVVRQNPTANVDGLRGGAAAAVPDVHVAQAPDGRLTIDYNAYDAYENPLGTAANVTVNGRITLSPQADGTVAIGGNTTIYPSMETYQYCDGQPPTQLQWTPANSGSAWGPSTSLSRHHWIGDTSIPPVRPNMPGWQWELENLNPLEGDPFISHTTQLTDPFSGGIPTVAVGR